MRVGLIDESKRDAFVMVVCFLAAEYVTASRKLVGRLPKPRQPRFHMAKEPDRRRSFAVATICDLPVTARVYVVAGPHRERDARARCLRALAVDLLDEGPVRLVLERDESMVSADARVIFDVLRGDARRPDVEFAHRTARDEPLLALPDVVAWCWSKDSGWRRQVTPLIENVRYV